MSAWLNCWEAPEKSCQYIADQVQMKGGVSGPDKLDILFDQLWLQFTDRILQKQLGKSCRPDRDVGDLENCLENYWPAFQTHKIFRRKDSRHEDNCLFLDADLIWLSAKGQLADHADAGAGINVWAKACIWPNQIGAQIEYGGSDADFDQTPAEVKHFLPNLNRFHTIEKPLLTPAAKLAISRIPSPTLLSAIRQKQL